MKKIKWVVFGIFSLVAIVIASLGFFVLVSAIQEKLFLPQEYIMWICKPHAVWLSFILKWYARLIVLYILSRTFRRFILGRIYLKEGFMRRHKRSVILAFVILNLVFMYTILYNVTVITNNKIIDYGFLSPQGKEYTYNDIVKIDTGVYGKRGYTHSKGDFYYRIQLNDGTKIDLAEPSGVKNHDDSRFVIEKLDKQYVNMGIFKVSSMKNFKYCTEHLDEIYTDKIRNILLNIE